MKRTSKDVSKQKKPKTILDTVLTAKARVITPSFLETKIPSPDLALFEIKESYTTPKAVEQMLIVSDYKPFSWAVVHHNFELMQYLINNNTERGKFLAVCHDNYDVINQFIAQTKLEIKEHQYQKDDTIETLKLLIEVKPAVIEDVIKERIQEQTKDGSRAARYLQSALNSAVKQI